MQEWNCVDPLWWLLSSVVNERGTGLVFCSCLHVLHFAVYFMNQQMLDSLERRPCGSSFERLGMRLLIVQVENFMGAKFRDS